MMPVPRHEPPGRHAFFGDPHEGVLEADLLHVRRHLHRVQVVFLGLKRHHPHARQQAGHRNYDPF